MDWRLLIAALLSATIAAAHSALGEKHILGALTRAPLEVFSAENQVRVRLTLRFAWHLTSLFLLACGGVLFALGQTPFDLAALYALEILGALFVVSAAITGSYSRGRHIGWPLFAGVGLLCWWAVLDHDGPMRFAMTAPGLGRCAATVLIGLGLLHLYWAIAGTANLRAVIPEANGKPLLRPHRIGTAAVGLGLLLAGGVVLAQATGLGGPTLAQALRIGCWMLAALLLARTLGDFRHMGLFKTIQTTPFGYCDTMAYTPLCLLLGLSVIAVAI